MEALIYSMAFRNGYGFPARVSLFGFNLPCFHPPILSRTILYGKIFLAL